MSDSHACVVNRDGTVWCWGSSIDNSVGTGRNKPAEDFATRVPGVSQALRLAADTHLSCAVLREGRLQCWGLTDHIVGSEHGDPTDAPVTSPTIADALDVASTSNEVSLLRRDGTVRMWESTISLHYFVMKKTPPGFCTGCVIDGLREAIQVSSGAATHCALLRSGTLRCWGDNATGQYGNGVFAATPSGTIPPRKPVEVPGLKNVTQVAVSGHVCALLKDGTLRCWGANNLAQTGVPGVNPLTKPTAVPGLAGVAQVAVGAEHTCARMSDATVRCWGNNDRGQLGDGTTTNRTAPVAVSSLNSVVSIAAGGGGSCAIRTDGSVWCWGQVMTLGDGSSSFRPTPGQVRAAIPK